MCNIKSPFMTYVQIRVYTNCTSDLDQSFSIRMYSRFVHMLECIEYNCTYNRTYVYSVLRKFIIRFLIKMCVRVLPYMYTH